MKKLLILIFIASITTAGCLPKTTTKNEVNQNTNQQVGLANPAAIYCENQGGTLKSVERDGGIDADCVFQDGTRCPQWEFFRGECAPEKGKNVMSPDACTNSFNGRVVNITGGVTCNDNEEKIGNVVGLISPNICCISKNILENETYKLTKKLSTYLISEDEIILSKKEVEWNTKDNILKLEGYGLGYGDKIEKSNEMDQVFQNMENYLKNQGFTTDAYNAGSGSPYINSSRFKNNDIVCNLTKMNIEEKASTEIEVACAKIK